MRLPEPAVGDNPARLRRYVLLHEAVYFSSFLSLGQKVWTVLYIMPSKKIFFKKVLFLSL
jgi:hypothetical protein